MFGIQMIADSFADAFLKSPCSIKPGSILRAELLFGYADHTGIYDGCNVIELNGDGLVKRVSLEEFAGEGSTRTDCKKYLRAACSSMESTYALYSPIALSRAESKLGTRRNYSFYSNNCHNFVSRCFGNRREITLLAELHAVLENDFKCTCIYWNEISCF